MVAELVRSAKRKSRCSLIWFSMSLRAQYNSSHGPNRPLLAHDVVRAAPHGERGVPQRLLCDEHLGRNPRAVSYGHIGADLITLASILRIPVAMHNGHDPRQDREYEISAFTSNRTDWNFHHSYGGPPLLPHACCYPLGWTCSLTNLRRVPNNVNHRYADAAGGTNKMVPLWLTASGVVRKTAGRPRMPVGR
jgi:hypothetical protein